MESPEMQAMDIVFDTKLRFTVHDAFLAAGGALLCDPVIKMYRVTTTFGGCHTKQRGRATSPKGSSAFKGGKQEVETRERSTVIEKDCFATTEMRLFTAHPSLDETFQLTVPHDTSRREGKSVISLEVRDGTSGAFLGSAECPFSLVTPGNGAKVRLMLMPRNCTHSDDPQFTQDMKFLDAMGLDDYGHITVSWDVSLLPFGGVPPLPDTPAPPPLPVGCVVKVLWLTSSSCAGGPGTVYSTMVDFTVGDRYEVDGRVPVFLTLTSVEQFYQANFLCSLRQGQHGDPEETTVSVKLPHISTIMDRDVQWCLPVISKKAQDWGVLMVSVRFTPKPIPTQLPLCYFPQQPCPNLNSPVHQASYAHEAMDWGRPMPNCPQGAFNPICWESQEHISRATERRWRRACVTESRPTTQHARHIFEVILGQVALDPNLAQMAASFFNKPAQSLVVEDMKALVIAISFAVSEISIAEACRFSFVVLRTDIENAITVGDVYFILENCLLPLTIDMPVGEVKRRIADIFGTKDDEIISFEAFTTYFINNYAHWCDLGVPVEHCSASVKKAAQPLVQKPPKVPSRPATAGSIAPPSQQGTSSPPAATTEDNQWREFPVRVVKTGKAFCVTAHVSDTWDHVAFMLQEHTGIPAERQRLAFSGKPLAAESTVGEIITAKSKGAVSVCEKEELLSIHFVYREKNKQWVHKISAGEKVLRLRALVQQKTMIPLSKIELRYDNVAMQDRHALSHYNLTDGSVVDILLEKL